MPIQKYGEICPIHHLKDCCGRRQEKPTYEQLESINKELLETCKGVMEFWEKTGKWSHKDPDTGTIADKVKKAITMAETEHNSLPAKD